MRPNLNYYVQTINDIVSETEELGGTMHPSYEKIREAIDNDKLADFAAADLATIVEEFESGTAKYEAMLKKITQLRPPAKVIGIHKKFEKAYTSYVEGCKEMIQSIRSTDGVDVPAFNAAEQKQDDASAIIIQSIEKLTKVLLGR